LPSSEALLAEFKTLLWRAVVTANVAAARHKNAMLLAQTAWFSFRAFDYDEGGLRTGAAAVVAAAQARFPYTAFRLQCLFVGDGGERVFVPLTSFLVRSRC
jgi:hypothetical protein